MKEEFVRNAVILKIVDGDTVDAVIDLGFSIAHEVRLRLIGIDAPERGQTGYKEATEYLGRVIPPGTNVVVRTYKGKEKYGRYMAIICKMGEDRSVNDQTILAQVAKPYHP